MSTTNSIEIKGHVAPGFEPVREAFEKNFASGLERGASVFVTREGEAVVDLWAGAADPSGRTWERDTIVNVYSTTKTMAALCVLMLADRGEVELDAPVARYWPEFAKNGKEAITVSHVMSHAAGLSGFDPPSKRSMSFTTGMPASTGLLHRRPGGNRAPRRATTRSPRATSRAKSFGGSPATRSVRSSAAKSRSPSTPTSISAFPRAKMPASPNSSHPLVDSETTPRAGHRRTRSPLALSPVPY